MLIVACDVYLWTSAHGLIIPLCIYRCELVVHYIYVLYTRELHAALSED